MISADRTVAIVGRPNVGKSCLFNRLARQRLAIVHDQPGVTRDVQAVEVENDFILLDTGGIGLVPAMGQKELVAAAEEQVFFAMQAAQAICLVVDGREGCTPLDEMIVERLRKEGKRPILVVNKIDSVELENKCADFAGLGLGPGLPVSAEHGRGIDALRDRLARILGPPPPPAPPSGLRRPRLCIAGRPNVGKSSLCNRLLGNERLVVNEIPGTTRDAISLDLDYTAEDGKQWHFRLTDTAGLRRASRVDTPVEYFSTVRSRTAINEADLVVLVLDAVDGVTAQDQGLAGDIVEAGKPLVVAVNKWDLAEEAYARGAIIGYENRADYRYDYEQELRREMFFLPGSPVVFLSAKSGYAVDRLMTGAGSLDDRAGLEIPTSRLNAAVGRLMAAREPKSDRGRRLKIYYATQVGIRPVRFRLFCNSSDRMQPAYQRYLEKGLREELGLEGVPLLLQIIGKPPRGRDRD